MDFRNLNQSSQKDNYPLPSLDKVLKIVNGLKMMSFLDGNFGYNQVMIQEEDRMTTTFTAKWGTFAYMGMPFGLLSMGVTFQRAMDEAFKGLVNKCIIIYMDDLTVFSKNQTNHITNLKQVLN